MKVTFRIRLVMRRKFEVIGMSLQLYVREAIEQMQQNARELLNGPDALKDTKQRTIIISIEGSTRILLDQYNAYIREMDSAEEWLKQTGYSKSLTPFSSSILNSIADSCSALHLLLEDTTLKHTQAQRIEAIARSQKTVAHELNRYMRLERYG